MVKEEYVSFKSGKHSLAGKLILPAETGSFPVIIFLQGSEKTSPLNCGFFSRICKPLLQAGIACFIYAKRGVDQSTGSWWRSSFHDRAVDTIAAIDYLKSREEIIPTKIGLFGHSQGGWICQLTASMTDDVAFFINSAGPGETVYEQVLTDLRNHLMIDQLPENIVNKKVKQLETILKITRTLKPIIKFHPLSYMVDYDPTPALEKIKCPMLALFGELDPLAPPLKNIPLLERGLKKANNDKYEIKVFKGANHSFYAAKTGSLKEYPSLTKEFVPGYLETICEWVLEQTKVS